MAYFFCQYEAHLDGLEKKIALAQERALEQAETDSLCTSLGPDDDTNYTFAEPEHDPPDHQMGSPSDHLLNYSGMNVINFLTFFICCILCSSVRT